MITLETPLVGQGGTVREAMVWALDLHGATPSAHVEDYIQELHRLCALTNIRCDVAFAQWAVETDDGASARWRINRNPAGLGVTSGRDPDPATFTGKDAARVHVWALLMAADCPTSMPLPTSARAFIDRWVRKYIDPNCPAVRTVADLNRRYVDASGEMQATWAWDERYGEKLVARANAIFGTEVPVAPVIYDLSRDYARFGLSQEDAAEIMTHRFDRGGITPSFIVLHIQAGRTRGSLRYWTGVQASSTVMIQHDGSILRVIPEAHGPWTNGDDANPTPAGQRLVNLPGNSNLYTLSIEAEGEHGGDTTPAQLDAIEWQVRDWMDRYDIPLANVIRHADINSVTRPNCPGAYYAEIIKRLSAKPRYAPPDPVPWPRGDVGYTTLGAAKAYKITAELTCTRETQPRKYASGKSERTGPAIRTGDKVTVIGTLSLQNGKRMERWLIREDGSRLTAAAFTPKLPHP